MCASLLILATLSPSYVDAAERLQFRIQEGEVLNAFHREGPAAAHLLLSNGTEPRILVAFPAGNSGVGVWFEKSAAHVHWELDTIESAWRTDAHGRELHGIRARVSADAPLIVRDAVLSSIRILRDYQLERRYPPEIKSTPAIDANTVEWARPRLDGGPGYALSLQVENGSIRRDGTTSIALRPSGNQTRMRVTITALTGDSPLTALTEARLLNARAGDDPLSRQVLRFLSYEEKFLAGSWRFDTYFGRDTLMSLRLLMPVLQPKAIESGLISVLERLAPNGEVAHEEDIGEFAILRHRAAGRTADATPIFDYNMIDDDFMLAPVTAAYVFEHLADRERARAFFERRLANGERVGAALARNFAWVIHSAAPFAAKPQPSNLIALKPGLNAGEWRDSQDGLAGGRYPYDVNAVLVPAALDAIERFVASGLLAPYIDERTRASFAAAASHAAAWAMNAPALFEVSVERSVAAQRVRRYAERVAVDASAALQALPKNVLTVNGIALDMQLRPIPVIHSDGGFALLLQNPPAARVDELVAQMMRPFPAGLLTDAGLLVANPALADPTIQARFGPDAYHGTVIWSWQQALFAAGLARQIAREDLPPDTRERLRQAQRRLWQVIRNAEALRASELWSWKFANDRYIPAPFGQRAGDADESNAAQLWSTVYLAIPPPVH
jgi:hypothetical protein